MPPKRRKPQGKPSRVPLSVAGEDDPFEPPDQGYRIQKDREEKNEDLPDRFIPDTLPDYETCPATTKFNRRCRRPAGAGTEHLGIGYCSKHGGNRPNHLIKLTRDFIMSVYGDPIEIDPQEALLKEVQRTAGHVEWMRALIGDFGDKLESDDTDGGAERALIQWTPLGVSPSAWLQIYHEERKHLVRVCAAAISAGVSERRVAIAEDQAKQLAMMFKAFMMTEALGMTPAQRIAAPAIIRELIELAPMDLEAKAAAFNVLDVNEVEPEDG